MAEYPTEEQLNKIKQWDTIKGNITDFIDYIRDIWWCPDFGFKITNIRNGEFELHTGGWSGNEEIIAALQSNTMFWFMYWSISKRGGHYWFKNLNKEANEILKDSIKKSVNDKGEDEKEDKN